MSTLVCLTALSAGFVWGQDRPASTVVVGASATAEMPVQVLAAAGVAAAAPIEDWAEGDPIKPTNPRQDHGMKDIIDRIPIPEGKPDVLMGFQKRASLFAAEPALSAPLVNIPGLGFSGVNPPDTCGDVGPNFYVQAINEAGGTRFRVYNKDGTIAQATSLLSDLGGPQGNGDPIVLYDQQAQRWLLSEFAPRGDDRLHVYISRTPSPISGGWFVYKFDTPSFPDYPKYGVWHDAYYVTTNESPAPGSPRPAIYALDRTKMLAGQAATMQRFDVDPLNGFGFQSLTPADLDGPAPPNGSPHYLMRHRDDEVHNSGANDPSQDFLDLYELRIDFGDPTKSTLTGPVGLPMSEFDSSLCGLSSFNCFDQKNSSTRLDPLREVIMNRLQYRNFGTHETMVGSFVTDVDGNDHGGIRWFELRKTAIAAWHVHQEGTYAPDSHHRWMSSIAMDGEGNIALAYNVSSDTIFPGIRYTGRLASDPMGTMPEPEQILVNGQAANSSMRYGDYAALSVDPSDDRVFWFTSQFNQQRNWTTRIASFRFHAEDELVGPAAAASPPPTLEERVRTLEEQVKKLLNP